MVPLPEITSSFGGELLQDGEHQFLAAHLRGAFHALLLGERQQLGRFLDLEFLEIHCLFNGLGNDARARSARAANHEIRAVSYECGPRRSPPGGGAKGPR